MNSNNPFETFGIEHLSNYSTTLFIENTPKWVLNYLYKIRSKTNSAMLRGTVVDHEIGRQDKEELPINESIQRAILEYDTTIKQLKKEDAFDVDKDKELKEKENLAKYLELAIPHYKNLGKPESYQKKIELQLDELPVPIIGYCDLTYKEGIVRDIKTTGKLPSEITDSVKRQLSIYSTALDGYVPLVDYVVVNRSRQEVITMQVNDVDKWMSQVKGAAIAIQNLLSLGDLNEITSVMYPDFSDWKWSEYEIAEAKKIWSIK
tara:strand:+ start:779 stop:1564 length:786 start_codon:yes stop_codon:yes gene_type:complete